MLATYVEAKRTPVTFDEAAQLMSFALASILRATPSTETLALGLAKTILECGRDTKAGLVWTSSYNHCVGNIKAGTKYEGLYTTYACNEVLAGKVVWFSPYGRLSGRNGVVVAEQSANPPGHPQTRFRAYASAQEGVSEYVEFVANGRYKDAFKELLEGDPDGYVRALHAKGYFTAPVDVYAKGVISLHREFVAKLSARPAPAPDFQPSVEVIREMVATQEWNQREVQALATAAATNAMFDNLLAHRGEPAETDDEDEPTKPDLPGNVT